MLKLKPKLNFLFKNNSMEKHNFLSFRICCSHELNLSATESAFTIVHHFSPKEDTESKDVMRVSTAAFVTVHAGR